MTEPEIVRAWIEGFVEETVDDAFALTWNLPVACPDLAWTYRRDWVDPDEGDFGLFQIHALHVAIPYA